MFLSDIVEEGRNLLKFKKTNSYLNHCRISFKKINRNMSLTTRIKRVFICMYVKVHKAWIYIQVISHKLITADVREQVKNN